MTTLTAKDTDLIALDRDGVWLRMDGRYVRAVVVRGPRPAQMRANAPEELSAFHAREQYVQALA